MPEKGKGNQGSPSGTPPSALRWGGRETTQTARETRAYALRLGPFHPFVVPPGMAD